MIFEVLGMEPRDLSMLGTTTSIQFSEYLFTFLDGASDQWRLPQCLALGFPRISALYEALLDLFTDTFI